ncbi:DUF4236 domain-containing protein [Fulvivirgaceae bacterium PWU5]|uniref:DUF4236 domain-containing protein n=1 Tax=Dawidia cretensis TaxID=2782350 RepID=A0AAP2E2U4_9BACT|nr:DUF4236 domain-containing protein [Dawidia cretensis]MBT1711961.1 DUF4236 domain-containing protein [Dawidia cretensis]
MAWSFRKSKSFGPFRFSFSNRGVGMSMGVKGARIGVNSRGTHVTLGANGIYYRKNIRGKSRISAVDTWSVKQAEFEAKVRDVEDDAAMNSLTDVDSQDFVSELESKAGQFAFYKPVLIAGLIGMMLYVGFCQSRSADMPIFLVLGIVLMAGWVTSLVWIRRWDERRRTMFVDYTMEEGHRELYDKFILSFQEFATTSRIWHNVATETLEDRRRHGGANQSVDRTLIKEISSHRLPSPHLVMNVSVPYMHLADKEVYFFPERIIFRRGRQLGAVFYKNIQIKREDVRFQESESLLADATVVDQRWQYLNKDGEPDRRFKGNRLLSICLYTEYTFTSGQGWNDTIMTSRTGAMDRFAEFIRLIGEYQRKAT